MMKSLRGEPLQDVEVDKCVYNAVWEPRDQEHARQYGHSLDHSPFFQTSAPLQAYHPNVSQLPPNGEVGNDYGDWYDYEERYSERGGMLLGNDVGKLRQQAKNNQKSCQQPGYEQTYPVGGFAQAAVPVGTEN